MRWAMGVAYQGTDFQGWQRQHPQHAQGNTLQATLEAAIARVANEPVGITCAGRTDKGVHATYQIIHVDVTCTRTPHQWLRGINTYLPSSLRVLWAHPVDTTFHARFSAQWRRYQYWLETTPHPSPLLRHHVATTHETLLLEPMQEAASFLIGTHNFQSFRAASCQARSPTRTVLQCSLHQQGRFVCLEITANAFLYHMVRNIMGSLMVVGTGEKTPTWFAAMMAEQDRRKAGPMAPAAGLYLIGVGYPEPWSSQLPPPQQLLWPGF